MLQTDDVKPLGGFRLTCMEILNWGTFDEQIWRITPESGNSLLTGNIGRGKSTLVDALTTLLVPPRKLAYNKAAGAEEKERSVESYFYGYYTSVQDESGKARPKGLRDGSRHYSVVLARFSSVAVDKSVTLAQLYWLKPGESKAKRLYVVAEGELTIADDFSGFGSRMNDLRKNMRRREDVSLFDNFAPYQLAFSKLLGLGSDTRVLELFNQTISMKSVGSVTEFVRHNMLEEPDIEKKVQELERNYDDLRHLHDAVVAARNKIELLTPVAKFGDEAIASATEREQYNSSRDVLGGYLSRHSISLYQQRLARQQNEAEKQRLRMLEIENQNLDHQQRIEQLNEDIRASGGDRLSKLVSEIALKENERDERQKSYQQYQGYTKALSLNDVLDVGVFVENIAKAKEKAELITRQLNENELQRDDVKYALREGQNRQQALGNELVALKKRQSNIPSKQQAVRESLCAALGIAESALPFIGELLQVKSEAQQWQGAAERVLHNFALSLLVPECYYAQVSDFIESTHLGTRLVYYRVKKQVWHSVQLTPGGLPEKIAIKPESEFYSWLAKELAQRFDYQCCDSLADFRRSVKAITLNGQMKSSAERHEKDDRYNLQDKSRYVLGWSNKEKIQLLATEYATQQNAIVGLEKDLKTLQQSQHASDELRHIALRLSDFNLSFEQINWPQSSEGVEKLREEHRQLEQSSDTLRLLTERLEKERMQLKVLSGERDVLLNDQGALREKIATNESALTATEASLAAVGQEQQEAYFPLIEEIFIRFCATERLTIEMLPNQESLLRQKLNEKIQHLEERRRDKEARMVSAMAAFINAFPNDATDLDSNLAALADFKQLLQQLQDEDLPRHEERFKEMLSRDTIRAMALFRSQLDRQEEEIKNRIRVINTSLQALDYQPGTYIELMGVASPDVEIREFKQRLIQCVEYSAGDELYSERKFEQVKSLIEQMRDVPKWTLKVVDVRFWSLFNVIERYREDKSEKECYSDSGGKSGGQKEKLAYSILAAAIMLQYRLVDEQVDSPLQRRFNLVVIDEAFARGSKDSTRFGLELFKKLGLQLLLVTPLQKLDVIEHYVDHVHFVDQRNNRSIVLNMTVEDYRQQLAKARDLEKYASLVSVDES